MKDASELGNSPLQREIRKAFTGSPEKSKVCPFCGNKTGGRSDFRDDISWREYNISCLCQGCQDKTFGA